MAEAQFLIRRATLEDAEQLCAMYSEPALYTNTMQLPYPDVESWRARLAEQSAQTNFFLAATPANDDKKVIGMIGIHALGKAIRMQHVRTLGLSVDQVYHGQGVGAKLLSAAIDLCENWFNVTRILLGVYSDNHRAIALYTRFGFVQEGVSRGASFTNGLYKDSIEMARIHPRLERELAERDKDAKTD